MMARLTKDNISSTYYYFLLSQLSTLALDGSTHLPWPKSLDLLNHSLCLHDKPEESAVGGEREYS